MKSVETSYGVLEGATDLVYYKKGSLKSCKLEKYNPILTSIGPLVPQYGEIDTRTKLREAISFYDTGELKSIYLKEPVFVNTSLGTLMGEFITFYKQGTIHRLFPLYGQVSGYWSEEEEYQLAEKVTFKIGDVKVSNRISSYCFYPNGAIKSLSLWNKEVLVIQHQKKNIAIRLGIAFYENGKIKSLEPYVPIKIKTPIGNIMAYNNEPVGIHGDTKSLILDRNGNVKEIKTVSTAIRMTSYTGEEKVIAPCLVRSWLDSERWVISPLTINFLKNQVRIVDKSTIYLLNKKEYKWNTVQIGFEEIGHACSNCKECGESDPSCGLSLA